MDDKLRDKAQRMIAAYEGMLAILGASAADGSVMDDAILIARAYLAEHREDDGERISHEWLLGIGFAWDDQQDGFGIRSCRLSLWIRINGQAWMHSDSFYGGRVCLYRRVGTRRKLRQLAVALGIELKEGV